jgi:hypothetical protein
MFVFSLAVSHAEDEKTDDTRGNTYVLSYAVKGSFGTASYVTVPGLASQEECNHLGVERTANPDQKHHPFRVGQNCPRFCGPLSRPTRKRLALRQLHRQRRLPHFSSLLQRLDQNLDGRRGLPP